VTEGTVQVNKTLSPLRWAPRSDGGFGSSREGGSGGPTDAQPASIAKAANPGSSFPMGSFMSEAKG
jgi:hypothetical protein